MATTEVLDKSRARAWEDLSHGQAEIWGVDAAWLLHAGREG